MDFFKYEATANDFIMLDLTSGGRSTAPDTARRLCHRRTGIGADGVIEMLPSAVCDVRMRILNADGSEAEMCGNGIRALFLFALDRGVTDKDVLDVETPAGARRVIRENGGPSPLFSVDMGKPGLRRSDIPVAGPPREDAGSVAVKLKDGTIAEATCVSMGNPHCVLFVEDPGSCPVSSLGPAIEENEIFPERTNVEFVKAAPGEALEVRVWERGVGETMACGTGACASLVAAFRAGLAGRRADVRLPGGILRVEWLDEGVFLTGPASHVFDGKTVE